MPRAEVWDIAGNQNLLTDRQGPIAVMRIGLTLLVLCIGTWAITSLGGLTVVGVLLAAGGLFGLASSSGQPGVTTGLGSVLVASVGICIALVGLVAAGRQNAAEGILSWIAAIPMQSILIGGFVVGVAASLFASRFR